MVPECGCVMHRVHVAAILILCVRQVVALAPFSAKLSDLRSLQLQYCTIEQRVTRRVRVLCVLAVDTRLCRRLPATDRWLFQRVGRVVRRRPSDRGRHQPRVHPRPLQRRQRGLEIAALRRQRQPRAFRRPLHFRS